MPRHRRSRPDGAIHHVLNRGNRRATVFHKPADYDAFFNLIATTLDHVPMRILSVCLMPNHFHLVVWPFRGIELSAYMHHLTNAHVRRYHRHYGTTGLGHVYQGRYKNFLVQSDPHLYNVIRYVEANPLRCGLVKDAAQWQWSSLYRQLTPDGRPYLADWPVAKPEDWEDCVNGGVTPEELSLLRHSARRGAPYGDQWWVRNTARRFGLESTLKKLGRPSRVLPTFRPKFE